MDAGLLGARIRSRCFLERIDLGKALGEQLFDRSEITTVIFSVQILKQERKSNDVSESRAARTMAASGSVQLGSVHWRIRHDTSGRGPMADASSALTRSTDTPGRMWMSHSARARSGMVLTPMPPSIRPVLTVMRRKVSASPLPEVASDTVCACAMVRSTAAGSEGAKAAC